MMRICALAIAGLLLAACGSNTNASAPVTRTVTTIVTSSSAATVSPSVSGASGLPICRAGDLSLAYLGGQGATGHGELGFLLRNTSSVTCGSYGYPGIQFLAKNGSALPTQPHHTTFDFFGRTRLRLVILHPGRTMSFRLGVTHGAATSAGCTTAAGLQVIAPNDTSTLRTTIPGGAYECTAATVSPVAPGSSAYH
jgi:hypothetical protein